MKKNNRPVITIALNFLRNSFINRSRFFQLFPTYWGLIPVRVEDKATTRNSIKTIDHKQDPFL